MSRLIDADALKEPLTNEYKKLNDVFNETSVFKAPNDVALYGALMQEVGAVIGAIDTAPTVEVPTWIPCSERLPESDEYAIVTILDERGDAPYRYADFGWYLDKANCWIVASEQRTDIIAWMPLPRAFKEKV